MPRRNEQSKEKGDKVSNEACLRKDHLWPPVCVKSTIDTVKRASEGERSIGRAKTEFVFSDVHNLQLRR